MRHIAMLLTVERDERGYHAQIAWPNVGASAIWATGSKGEASSAILRVVNFMLSEEQDKIEAYLQRHWGGQRHEEG